MAFSDQSRILGAGKSKNYSEILFQQDKKLLDSEVNLVQKVINERMRELMRHGLKYDSGFIKISTFSSGATPTSFKMGSISGDVNRIHINGYVVDILGTASTNDYENIIEMPAKPSSGTRNDLVFIELWESILEYNTDTSNNVNKPSTSTIYKYGNTLYGGTNINDEIRDISLGEDTADRVQIQYEIRVVENATSLVGETCKDGASTFSQATDPVTGEALVGLYSAQGTNNQYARTEYDENNNSLGYGYHWAIPIAIVPRDSAESSINVGAITDTRMLVGVTNIDPDADYTLNKLIANSDIEVGGNLYPSSSSGHTLGKPGYTWDALYLSSKIYYGTDLKFDSSGEKIYFKTDGKVGLGIDPIVNLDIFNSSSSHIRVQGSNSSITPFDNPGSLLHLTNNNTTAGNYSLIKFSDSVNDVAAIASINKNHSTNEGDLAFATREGSGSLLEKMRLKADGKLGLGVSDPIQELDIRGNAYISGNIGIRTDASLVNSLTVQADNGILGFTLQNTSLNSTAEIYSDASGHGVISLRLDDSTKNAEIRADGISFFKGGNVGIGTNAPSEKFEVVGGNVKVEDLIIGSTPVRMKEVSGEIQLRNYADTLYSNFRCFNLTVDGTLTTKQYQEVQFGDNEIQLNALINDFANNSDAGIRVKLLDDHNVRTIQSITALSNTIVVDVLGGIIAADFIEVKNTVNGNDGQYKVISTSGSGPYSIIIDSAFKSLTADEGSGGKLAREVGSRIRWVDSDGKFIAERIDGSKTDFQVQGDIFGKSDSTSTLGKTTNRWATLYMASDIDYSSNLTFSNSGEKMRLTSSGFLGLGTSSPISVLDIYRNVASITQTSVRNPNTAGGSALLALNDLGSISLQAIGSTNALGSAFQGFGRLRTEPALNGLQIATGSGPLIFLTADNETLRILPNGNVGIGINVPSAKLDIKNGSASSYGLRIIRSSDANILGGIYEDVSGHAEFVLKDATDNIDVYLKANGNSYFNGGNLGIGTTNPTEKLYVNGKIYSTGDIETAGNLIGASLVSSLFKTTNITFSNDDIYEHYTNSDLGTVWINRKGYLDSISNFRNFKVADGKGNLVFGVEGSSKFITALGNVGIGTTSPAFISGGGLHIDAGTTTRIHLTSTATGATASDGAYLSVGSDSDFYLMQMESANMRMYINGDTRMLIDSTGKVGIGTTTPNFLLDVRNSATGALTVATFANTNQAGSADEVSIGLMLGRTADSVLQYGAKITAVKEQQWTATPSTVDSALSFYTNQNESVSERMRITSSGYVGIGTITPIANLTLAKDAANSSQPNGINNATDTHTTLVLSGGSTALGEKTGMQFAPYVSALPVGAFYSIGGIFSVLDSVSGNTTGDITFDMRASTSDAALTEVMRITHEGNVGIGTALPATLLNLQGIEDNFNTALNIDKYGINVNYWSTLRFRRSESATVGNGATTSGTTLGELEFQGNSGSGFTDGGRIWFRQNGTASTYTPTDIYIDTSDGTNAMTTRMLIDKNGNVGIGTFSPQDRLHIDGNNNSSGLRIYRGSEDAAQHIKLHTDSGQAYFDMSDTNRTIANGIDLNFRAVGSDGTNTIMFLNANGKIGIGDTLPEGLLTLNQGSDDNAILSFKSSDVGHSMTAYGQTDTYANFKKRTAANGGLNITALTDADDVPFEVFAWSGVTNPTDSTPMIRLVGGKYDGITGATTLGNTETVLSVINYTTNLFNILGNGTVGIGTTTPGYDVITASGDFGGFPLHIKGSTATGFIAEGTIPYIALAGIGQTVDSRIYDISVRSDKLVFRALTDSLAAGPDNILVLDHSGNVGIGKNNPAYKIDILDQNSETNVLNFNSTPAVQLGLENSNGTLNTYTAIKMRAGSADNAIITQFVGANQGDIAFINDNSGATETLRIKYDGNVGIGETDPDTKLHIRATNENASIILENTAANKVWRISPSVVGTANSGLSFYNVTDASTAIHIDDNGKVGIGITTPGEKLHTYDASTNVYNKVECGVDGNATAWYKNSQREWYTGVLGGTSGKWGVYDLTGTATRMVIDSAGNIGIGIASPSATMEIASTDSEIMRLGRSTSQPYYLRTVANNNGIGFYSGPVKTSESHTLQLANGKVGIGTPIPSTLLHLEAAAAPALTFVDQGTSTALIGTETTGAVFGSTAKDIDFRVGMTAGNLTTGTTALKILSTGNISIGGTVSASGGNSTQWTAAYADRLKWDGGSAGLNAVTGRASLGLGTLSTQSSSSVNITGGSISGGVSLSLTNSSFTCDILGSSFFMYSGATTTSYILAADGSAYFKGGVYINSTSSNNFLRNISSGSGHDNLWWGNYQIVTASDRRLKDIINNSSKVNVLEGISKINFVDYTWNDPSDVTDSKNKRGIWTGLIAQELIDIFPTMVVAPRDENDNIDYDDESLWSLDQNAVMPMALKAIQELNIKNKELEEKITKLEKLVENLL